MTKIAKIAALRNTAIVVGTAEAWQALALALLASQRKPKAAPKGKAVWPPPICRLSFADGYSCRLSIHQGVKDSHESVIARATRIGVALAKIAPWLNPDARLYWLPRDYTTATLVHVELVKTGGADAEDMENLPSLAAA